MRGSVKERNRSGITTGTFICFSDLSACSLIRIRHAYLAQAIEKQIAMPILLEGIPLLEMLQVVRDDTRTLLFEGGSTDLRNEILPPI